MKWIELNQNNCVAFSFFGFVLPFWLRLHWILDLNIDLIRLSIMKHGNKWPNKITNELPTWSYVSQSMQKHSHQQFWLSWFEGSFVWLEWSLGVSNGSSLSLATSVPSAGWVGNPHRSSRRGQRVRRSRGTTCGCWSRFFTSFSWCSKNRKP